MLLLIDLQHIYYRCWFTRDRHAELLTSSGRNVAHVKVVYDECLKIVDDVTFRYDADKVSVAVCCEGAGSIKKELYPEYKANRTNRLDANNYTEIAYIAGALEKLGATTIAVNGYEADDVVYTLTKHFNGQETVVYTNDADLLMHVNENVDVWIRRNAEYRPVTRKRFAKQASFICKRDAWYNDIVMYKSCVGDTSDNIKGVRGYGGAAYSKRLHLLEEQYPNLEIPTGSTEVLKFAEEYMAFTPDKLQEFEHSLKMVSPLYCPACEGVDLRAVPISNFSRRRK
ncbi:hypothetical protein FACS1894208_00150 [Clostridia bacterium]|nr:hypothetical protein FACS1894208_00150 [Clostridia bacterium]